jgi:hypothetical protein
MGIDATDEVIKGQMMKNGDTQEQRDLMASAWRALRKEDRLTARIMWKENEYARVNKITRLTELRG